MSTTVLTAPVTKTFGRLTITAQITVDGGYSVNVFTGPIREDALCFTTSDRATYRRAYRVIAEGGLNSHQPERIHAALTVALTYDRTRAADLGHTVAELDRVLDQLATPAQSKSDADMLAGIRANLRKPARSFAEYRARTLAAFDRDRTEVAGQADLFETAVA